MSDMTPIASSAGGLLIGLSATMLLLTHGRIAGISGILSGALARPRQEGYWRLAFVAGLVAGGAAAASMFPQAFAVEHGHPAWTAAVGGALVGVGVRLGNGCTSGHGVCGISRGSKRSLLATLTFITTGALTIAALRVAGITS